MIVFARGKVVETGTPDELAARSGLVRIAFRPEPGRPLPELGAGAGTVDEDGTWVCEVGEDAVTQALADLTAWSLRGGAPLAALTVTRPSLEDTYLELIDDEQQERADA